VRVGGGGISSSLLFDHRTCFLWLDHRITHNYTHWPAKSHRWQGFLQINRNDYRMQTWAHVLHVRDWFYFATHAVCTQFSQLKKCKGQRLFFSKRTDNGGHKIIKTERKLLCLSPRSFLLVHFSEKKKEIQIRQRRRVESLLDLSLHRHSYIMYIFYLTLALSLHNDQTSTNSTTSSSERPQTLSMNLNPPTHKSLSSYSLPSPSVPPSPAGQGVQLFGEFTTHQVWYTW
jgi:hypothetical protein